MKNEKKLKEYETVWTCDYCGKEFKTKNESDKHELVCDKNPDSVSFPLIRNTKKSWLILWITTMVVFGITVYVNSKLLSLGFNLFNKKWFLNLFFGNIILGIVAFLGTVFSKNKDKKKVFSVVKYSFILCLIYLICHAGIILSLDTSFKEQERKSDYLTYQEPTPKTELQNVKYNGKVISGAVVNKSDKPIFNSKVVLKISKDRTAWEIDETHEFIVPYKIDPNQSINFSENYKTTKKDPWWTTLIQESHFYNGENILIPTTIPTKKPVDTDPIIDCKFDAGQCKGASIKVRNSQCLNTTCCQIGNNWIPYVTVQKCKEAQNTYANNNQIVAPTYKPNNPSYTSGEVKISCSYHSGDYNFDYGMLTYDECKIKSDAYWNSKKASLYTPTPSYNVPTVAPTPNISNLCNQAVSDWNSYVTEFYATQYNNYSSSAEAIRALENERQEFQNLLNSYGCNITLRLM